MTEPVYVVADIGGTNARFAHVNGRQLILRDIEILPCEYYSEPSLAIKQYVKNQNLNNIKGFCIAVAADTDQPLVKLSNNDWQFTLEELKAHLDAPLLVINDFDANAYALNVLETKQYQWLNKHSKADGNKVVLGPGTGLGVTIVTKKGEVMASEGGHVGFAPHNQHENLLLAKLLERYQRVSIERVLSGVGLSNLYWANSLLKGAPLEIMPSEVVAKANAGEALAQDTIIDFFNIFASFIGDIAIMTWATGGIYLTGGVLEKLWTFYDSDAFLKRLSEKGRFSNFCRSLPIAKITAEYPGMLGCAYAIRQGLSNK